MKINLNNHLKKKIGLTIFSISLLSLIIGFFYNEDGTGLALSGDFRDTLPYIFELKKSYFIDPTPWTLHFPLHYIFFSIIDSFLNNINFTRFFFCLLAIIVPVLFYKCLRLKFGNNNKNIHLILSSVIFFTPGFRYSAIWANDHITALIFFLLSIFFFIKWSNHSNELKNKNVIYVYLSLFFLAICCYERQYYVVFFIVFLYIFFKNLFFDKFIFIVLFCLALSLPGFFILYKFPDLFNQLSFTNNIYNNIFGNFSALLVYVFPIFLLNLLKKSNKIINYNKIFILFIVSFCIFFLFKDKLDYQNTLSLGAFFVISKSILGNYFLFYFVVILALALVPAIIEYKIDFVMIFLTIFVFSGSVVIQKYFEPFFYFIFFLLMSSNFKNIFLKNYKIAFLLFVSYVFYYFIAISKILHKFSFA
jgi:hypothetical protein